MAVLNFANDTYVTSVGVMCERVWVGPVILKTLNSKYVYSNSISVLYCVGWCVMKRILKKYLCVENERLLVKFLFDKSFFYNLFLSSIGKYLNLLVLFIGFWVF